MRQRSTPSVQAAPLALFDQVKHNDRGVFSHSPRCVETTSKKLYSTLFHWRNVRASLQKVCHRHNPEGVTTLQGV